MTPRWTPRALRDVGDIIERIQAEDPQAAKRLLDRVLEFVNDRLTAQPRIGQPGRVADTREFVLHSSYILVYRVENDRIDIIAFRHSARLWPDHF